MRAIKTILSISFLVLTSSIIAEDKEESNEFPDEIKNLSQKQILNSVVVDYKLKTSETSSKLPPIISVVVKLKFDSKGSVDTAVVVYCEEPNIGYEKSAIQAVLESDLKPRFVRRKVDKSWFYTEVVFNRVGYNRPKDTDSPSLKVDSAKQNGTNIDPVEIPPELRIKAVPKYPKRAQRKGVSGTVWLRVLVGITGRPLDAIIQKTTDTNWDYGFNESALKAVMKCEFKPATQNGKPVKVWVSFPYEFILYPKR